MTAQTVDFDSDPDSVEKFRDDLHEAIFAFKDGGRYGPEDFVRFNDEVFAPLRRRAKILGLDYSKEVEREGRVEA